MKALPTILLLTAALSLSAATVRYVDTNSTNPVPPFITWSTAATNIQDAVDTATAGDEIIATNGVYATGGRAVYGLMTNRVVVDKPLALRSVNGPSVTMIEGRQVPGSTNGDGAIRCVYLADGAVLIGFTLTNGATRAFPGETLNERSGGGIYCASTNSLILDSHLVGNAAAINGGGTYLGTLSNCTIRGNNCSFGGGVYKSIVFDTVLSANKATDGGGAYRAMLTRSTLTNNNAAWGGAAHASILIDCTLLSNEAETGGGCSDSTVNRCTLGGNHARLRGGAAYQGELNECWIGYNTTGSYGGGVASAFLDRCFVVHNRADSGGGAYIGRLTNCIVTGNFATNSGGGVYEGFLINCTVVDNLASYAGGADHAYIDNSIVYYNSALLNENFTVSSHLRYVCTTPDSVYANATITNPPLFVERSAGNFRLLTNSPCIDAGNNDYASGLSDADGNTRIANGRVDIGAYEHHPSGTILPIKWLQKYGFPTDGTADFTDNDGDGLNNWEEWRCGTNPTNSLSSLLMLSPEPNGPSMMLRWQSVPGRVFVIERRSSLSPTTGFSPIRSNVLAQPIFTGFRDTNIAGAAMHFYRVGVQ